MFETIFTSASQTELPVCTTILSMGLALLLGIGISLAYLISGRKNGDAYSVRFIITLALLPCMVSVVIVLVGTNVARAFSIAGVFSLVRFRSLPGDSRDISCVFFAMAVGLSVGMGFLTLAVLVTFFIGLAMVFLYWSGFAVPKVQKKELKITVPENMNFTGAFDDLLIKNTENYSLERIRTTNMGTLYELTFSVQMKKEADEKEMIDAIRCRNGNLNIVLCRCGAEEATL
ncbi:MAG: DUF4956 domain-containing protein [Lachnospiraceae bacterium]|nr:DUF4956 domain-containing protein [Lachnospiraceae bacterium]